MEHEVPLPIHSTPSTRIGGPLWRYVRHLEGILRTPHFRKNRSG